jgi:CPA2 family monovalent cation:H+ antiporter-2
LPLRDAFSVLFFVSVGMLFEPTILLEQPVHVLGDLAPVSPDTQAVAV